VSQVREREAATRINLSGAARHGDASRIFTEAAKVSPFAVAKYIGLTFMLVLALGIEAKFMPEDSMPEPDEYIFECD